MHFLRRLLPFLTVVIAICVLYLYDLTGVGVLSTDEPRYAAIGQSMAVSGDLVTPKLWGSPWFEKPPALYWMTALATRLGAGADLAGRLPVTLLSLTFLAAYLVLLRREFGTSSAVLASASLATSAGWLAYSELCLTDLPVAAFFSIAALLTLPLLRAAPDERRLHSRMALVGIFLGLGTLAKGLVPLGLAVPFFWYLRRYWRSWWAAAVACVAVAGPWYVAVTLRNGRAFIDEFFIRHHFERLYSASLEHVQPWYYYLPVLLAGLFPWTPLLAFLPTKSLRTDRRLQFLAAVVLFGFVLFSSSLNKLPGYILPLLPCLFAFLASRFSDRPLNLLPKAWMWASALLIGCIPMLAGVLPVSLGTGRISISALQLDKTGAFYSLAPIVVVLLARRSWLVPLLLLCVVANGLYLKAVCFPALDRQVSARSLWKQIQPIAADVCDGGTNRAWIYGLDFYRGAAIPRCGVKGFRYMITSQGHAAPVITERATGSR